VHGSLGDIEILDPRQDNIGHASHISIMANVLQFIHLHFISLNKVRQVDGILACGVQKEIEIEFLIVVMVRGVVNNPTFLTNLEHLFGLI
jgi:hypothetical protein